jgi:hypothetical protein
MAKSLLGQHLAANNAADGYGKYGCAESLNAVWTRCFGHPIGGGASTALMLQSLKNTNRFVEIPFMEARPGDIIIAATNTSTKYPAAQGKVNIMSNSSETTAWTANYTKETWKAYFNNVMGFPTRAFRPIA